MPDTCENTMSQRTSNRSRTVPRKFDDYETNDCEMKKVSHIVSDEETLSESSSEDEDYKDFSSPFFTDNEEDMDELHDQLIEKSKNHLSSAVIPSVHGVESQIVSQYEGDRSSKEECITPVVSAETITNNVVSLNNNVESLTNSPSEYHTITVNCEPATDLLVIPKSTLDGELVCIKTQRHQTVKNKAKTLLWLQ